MYESFYLLHTSELPQNKYLRLTFNAKALNHRRIQFT